MILTHDNARPTFNFTPALSSFIPTRQTVAIKDRPLFRRCDQETSFHHPEASPKLYVDLGESENCWVRGFYPSSIE